MPETTNYGELTSASPSQFLRALFDGFLFRLLLGGGGWSWSHRSRSCSSFSTGHLQTSISLQKASSLLFTVSENTDHGLPHFLATARTMNMATNCSRTTDPDKALKGSKDHGHQPGPRWHCRSLTSIWPLEAAWSMDLNMASGNRTDHRHSQRVGIIIFLVVCVVGQDISVVEIWLCGEEDNRAVWLKHIACRCTQTGS